MSSTLLPLRALRGGAIATWAKGPRQAKEAAMRKKWVTAGFLGLLIFGAGLFPAFAGDALYGKVTAVRSAEVVILNYGTGEYVIRVIGIDVPKEGPIAQQALEFVSKIVLGKVARLRFEYRTPNGEMVSRLFTGDPGQDVGLELVKAGLARRQKGYDYKYGELSKAESEAQKARRGLWAVTQPE